LLRELEKQAKRIVVADFEAGVGTMTRTDAKLLDLAVVVVEPYMKSIETARRLVDIVKSSGGKRVVVVANKIRGDEDLEFLREKMGLDPDIVVPEDRNIAAADLAAVSPIDRNPNSPAVKAIRDLASQIAA
jgi:CO dehydrogenase maturation factor